MLKEEKMMNGTMGSKVDSWELTLEALEKVSGGTGLQNPPKTGNDNGKGIWLPEIDE